MDRPTKQEISDMPPFTGLPIECIHIIDNSEAVALAKTELSGLEVIGFDTESKPTFVRGEKSTGPHLIQFASEDKAYLIPVSFEEGLEFALEIARDNNVLKVGFGVSGDRKLFHRKFASPLNNIHDLSKSLRAKLQLRDFVGAKTAVAMLFGQRLSKSSQVSDWSCWPLSKPQIMYAANDAFACMKCFSAGTN